MSSTQFINPEFAGDISNRIHKIHNAMAAEGADALIVAYNPNIYYTTGRFFRGYVFIRRGENPVYFVIRPNDIAPAGDIVMIRKPEQIPAMLTERGVEAPASLGLEIDSLSYSDVQRLKALFPDARLVNGSQILRHARMTKTPFELELMRRDGGHQAAVYHRVPKCYKSDMTDVELQIEIERVLRLEGCLGLPNVEGNLMEINLGSLLAGDNADVPSPYDFSMGGAGTNPALPVGADGTTIRNGSTIMVDMNGSFNGYQTDMTRVWRLGEISPLAIKAHECSRKILRRLEKEALPGVKCSELYHMAMEIVEADELTQYFMGHRQKAAFIGHGVGIQLNEPPVLTPRSSTPLEENMTLAIEPKFVIPGTGAVGVENTYIVTPSGLECITVFPEEINEI